MTIRVPGGCADCTVLAFSVFGVEWQFIKPFIVIGLAFGGVYALSGVGLVVLYRATGVLNLAFGAIGAAGALIAYWHDQPHELAATGSRSRSASLFGGVVNLALRDGFRPRLRAARSAREDDGDARPGADPARRHGVARAGRRRVRALPAAAELEHRYEILETTVNLTQIIALALAIVITAAVSVFLRVTKLGTAMRALANDREITATLGVPVRRVEAAAWFGSGLVCGAAGLLLPDLLTSLDYSALTFLVISSLAAALIGRLQSLWVTMFGGLAVGLAQAVLSPYASLSALPLRGAVRARDRRALWTLAAPRRHDRRGRRRLASGDAPTPEANGAALGALRRRRSSGARSCAAWSSRPPARSPRSVLPSIVGADWITTFTSVAIYSVVGAGLRDPLRPRRDDLARPGRAARRSAAGSGRGSPTRPRSRSRCCCSSRVRSPARSGCWSGCRRCGSRVSTSR